MRDAAWPSPNPPLRSPPCIKISRPIAAPRPRRQPRSAHRLRRSLGGGGADPGRHPLCRPRRQHALQCRLGADAAAAITRSPPPIFDEVERQHPYSVWARRAQLMSAFCYYAAARPYQVDRIGAALPLDPSRQPRRALCALSDRAQLLRADQRRDPRPGDHPPGAGFARRGRPPLSRHALMPTTRG